MSVSSKKRSKKGSLARQRQKTWRNSSVVWRASETVGEEVNAIVAESPFLKAKSCEENGRKIALFRRSEIVVGDLLGQGGFAEVFEVKGFDWMDPSDDLDDKVLQQEQSELRRSCESELKQDRFAAAEESDNDDCRYSPYALKQLRKGLIRDKVKSFQRAAVDLVMEAEYLASLSHPNIVKIRGLTLGGTTVFRKGQHDEFFIMMDRLSETLKRRIHHLSEQSYHPLDLLPVMIKYALDIGNALEYLHKRFIMYRDLKPANLGFKQRAISAELGGKDDIIQFFDFGLCRELPRDSNVDFKEDETFLMSAVGTQRYMAPEIANRQPYNLKADVYSWAMVFFEMLTLTKPFPNYTMEQHTRFVGELGERPVMPTDVNWPEGLEDFLQRAWRQEVPGRLSISEACRELQVIHDRVLLTKGGTVVKDEQQEQQRQQQQQQQQQQQAKKELFSSNSTHSSVVLELPSNFDSEYRFSSKKTSPPIRKLPKKVLSTNSSSSILENTMELTATSGSIGTTGLECGC